MLNSKTFFFKIAGETLEYFMPYPVLQNQHKKYSYKSDKILTTKTLLK